MNVLRYVLTLTRFLVNSKCGADRPFFSKVHNSSQFVDRKFGRAPWREISLDFSASNETADKVKNFDGLRATSGLGADPFCEPEERRREGGALERTEYFSRIELEYMDERNYFKMNFKKNFLQFWNNVQIFALFIFHGFVYCIYFTFPSFKFL